MDRRKNYYCVFDTETANGYMDGTGKLCLDDSLVYDIGWQIIDKKGNVYERRSYIVKEIFEKEQDMMTSAYYAKKIPQYKKDIENGTRTVSTFYLIRKAFLEDCEQYNVVACVAHNARFDYRATNNTQRWLTKSKYRYFLPYGMQLFDTMKMAQDTIAQEKGYQNFCACNGFMTKHKKPKVRVTAEILYRYISGDINFQEKHTGLEDVEIESQIFAVCINKHKKMRKSVWG